MLNWKIVCGFFIVDGLVLRILGHREILDVWRTMGPKMEVFRDNNPSLSSNISGPLLDIFVQGVFRNELGMDTLRAIFDNY